MSLYTLENLEFLISLQSLCYNGLICLAMQMLVFLLKLQLFDRGTQTANHEPAAVPVHEPQGLLISKFILRPDRFKVPA